MRVDRALEEAPPEARATRPHVHGVRLTAALADRSHQPAPAALASTIASTALASGTAVGSTTLTLLKMMTCPKPKSV